MARKLRVAAVQLRSGVDAPANRAHALPFLREAAAGGARLIATPEMTMRLDLDRKRLMAVTTDEKNESELSAWGRIAQELGVWILMGSAPIDAGNGKVFNRSFLFDDNGKIAARYDKIHMFDVTLGGTENYRESNGVEAGRKAVLTAGPMGVKLGLTICYDMRFPNLYRTLGQAGAELIAVPAAFTVPTGKAHWETLLRARAIENGVFILAPAQGGVHEDGRATWGHSVIIDPWGKVLAMRDNDEPGVVMADIDLDQVVEARAKVPAWMGGPDFEKP